MGNPLTAIPMRAARWSALHPWRAILAWVALVLVAVALAAAVPSKQTSDADFRLGESGHAAVLMDRAGLTPPDTESVLFTARSGHLDPADARQAAAELARSAAGTRGVARVGDPVVNRDGDALLVPIDLVKNTDHVTALQAVTAQVQRDHPDLSVRETGDISIGDAIDNRVGDDLGSAETISLPVTLILMLLAFGALIAAGIPVLLAATSVATTIGLMAPLSHLIHGDPTVSSMIVLIGMAVGVDYSLFYLKREREERRAGRTTLDAVEIAAETSGHSVLVSGGAVIAAMAGLFLADDPTFRSLAVGAILVVAVAVLGSITVLPALLVKLGRWVDRPRVPFLWRVAERIRLRRQDRPGLTGRLMRPVVRHPAAALLLGVVVVGGLAVPALGMRTHSGTLETLPASIPEVSTMRDVSQQFPSDSGTTAQVVVRSKDHQSAEKLFDRLVPAAVATGDFVKPSQPARVSSDGRTAVLTLGIPYPPADDRTASAVRELRGEVLPAATKHVDGIAEYAVGGSPAQDVDYVDHEHGRLVLVIGFVLLLTMLIMLTTFRSVALALVSTALNVLSVGAAFGVMTLVFQHGWFSGSLDFESPGFVIDWIPLFVLVVLVGLSMDYHVFVISRIREYVDQGMPTRIAVEKGIGRTAGVVTSAAAVMVSVFAIFASLSMIEMKMMGVGLATAILIDATLVRLVMLPALLALLGERAWWPRRVRVPRGRAVTEPEPAYAEVG